MRLPSATSSASMSANRLPPVRVGVSARLAQHQRGARRQIRIAVDLAVRMGQRHADLLAAVLEAEHLLDAGPRHQIGGAVPPRVDDEPGVRQFELGERAGVVAGEADHLAPAVARARTGTGRRPTADRRRRTARCPHRTGWETGSRRPRRRSRGRASHWSARTAPGTAGIGRAAACRCGPGAARR